MNDLDIISLEAKGFISAQIAMPFEPCPVLFVTQEEMARELSEVVSDLFDNREEGGLFSQIGEGVEKQIIVRSTGFFSKRILGLYSQRYFSEYENRILLVRENIENVAGQLGIDYQDMLAWVVTHEMMHGAQFNGDSPLRKRISEKVVSLAGEKKINKEELKTTRAWMTWIEGSADFVMDQPGLLRAEDIGDFRAQMNLKREARTWSNFLLRLLGNKSAQYIEGAQLIREAYPEIGEKALSGPIQNPDLLPSPEEVVDATLWKKKLGNRDSNPD